MNINQIEWCSYTEENPDYVQEIEFLEWQSDPEGKFCKSDVCKLFQSITFAYSKVLEYIADVSFEEAHERMQSENYANFFEKLEEVFKEVPFRNGITYSKLEEIMSVIKIPKICK